MTDAASPATGDAAGGRSAPPVATVLIPVRNGENFLREAIESVLGQSYPHVRLVVSDNASTDSTPRILESYADADSRVRFVRQPRDLGMNGNLNFCLSQATTDYHMVLCHDDLLYRPDSIERAVEVLRSDPAIGAVYSSLAYVDGRKRLITIRRFGHGRRAPSAKIGRKSLIHCRNLFGIPVLVRSELVRGKAYDPSLPYAGDVELSMRYGGLEMLNYYFDEPLVANRYHSGNATYSLCVASLEEFRIIERMHGIRLSALERAHQYFNFWLVTLQKKAFLGYMRLRG